MALSNAEKVRRYRERQKEALRKEMKEPTPASELFKVPFFEFFDEDRRISSQYSQSLELGGIHPLQFDDDTGPEVSTLDDFGDGPVSENDFFGEHTGTSLGKAEVLIGCLLAAAQDLADWVNAYKVSELQARLAELKQEDLADTDAKERAFLRIAEINKMQEALSKTIRVPVKLWKTPTSK